MPCGHRAWLPRQERRVREDLPARRESALVAEALALFFLAMPEILATIGVFW
jgi:hypothetical protein